MTKKLTILLLAAFSMAAMAQTTEITTTVAKNYYKNTSKNRVSVHDPSVVYDSIKTNRYYIFGSHRGVAYSTDLQNWTPVNTGKEINNNNFVFNAGVPWKTATSTNAYSKDAFSTPAVTKVMKGGVEHDLPAFDALNWAARTDDGYDISGNLWAPDVIWNPIMNKWCMYMSINGNAYHSSIVLLTSDKVDGPYEYQAPIVISGFDRGSHSFKDTDYELVTGDTSLPSRYNTWASTRNPSFPNNIDPCVFYDEDGKLWIAYGSWSGGVFMLELDETTGLRDYDVTYTTTDGDPYFGKRIAGGYYVSGEAPYIEHIGNYYYLFMSYGNFTAGGVDDKGNPVGGYVMRMFRSANPNGPYKDAKGTSAVYSSYALNYGNGSDTRGVKVMGPYDHWGFMSSSASKEGELSQGHNSIIAAPDGRTYLVYHTRFNKGYDANGYVYEGHSVRVHQMFLTKNDWLVASPFEYNGEKLTDEDLASSQIVATEEIPGDYHLLVHKYKNDLANFETVEPVTITLTADGKVTGAYTGTWSLTENTSYLTIKLGSITYNGVLFEQQMDGKNIKSIAFSALATSGVNIWGYKYRDDYSVAYQVNTQKLPVSNLMQVKQNLDLYNIDLQDNIKLQWTSSEPMMISDYGKYYPMGLTENTPLTLTARITSGNYYWQQAYNVYANSETNSVTPYDWTNGMLARYSFDDEGLTNSVDVTQHAQLNSNGNTAVPQLEADADSLRNGKVVHLHFGVNAKESFVTMPNPFKGQDLSNGATLSFFVKRFDNNLWDALFGVTKDNARLYMTANLYVGYNDGRVEDADGGIYNNWLDINKPDTVETNAIGLNHWHMVTVTISPTASTGITFYIDGVKRTTVDRFKGKLNGTAVSAKAKFDYKLILQLLSEADELWLGKGSFWGSPDVAFDELVAYNRLPSINELKGLLQMVNRSDENHWQTDAITTIDRGYRIEQDVVYDLQGRRMDCSSLKPGLYIMHGRKVLVK